MGLAALVAAAGWWVAIDLLTPAASRPYVGGSTDNNILQLTFGYNGVGRLTGSGGGAPGGGAGGGLFGGATGITRLFESDMGSQISWLLPAALIALAALVWLSWRSPRTGRTRAAALLWGGWLVVTGLVFSFMSGIIHPYYTVALAPAIAALAGIGAVALWRIRSTWAARLTLAGSLLVTAAWAWVLLDRSPGWYPWLRVVIAVAAAGAAAVILAGPAARAVTARGRTALAIAPLSLALIAGLGGPLAYSIDTAATAHGGSIPTAGPSVAGSAGGPGGAGGSGFGGPGGSGHSGTRRSGARPSGTGRPGTLGAGTVRSGTGRPGSGAFPGSAGNSRAAQHSSGAAAPAGEAGSAGRPSGTAPGGAGGTGSVSRALSRLLESGAPGYRWSAATVGSSSAASLELSSNGVPVMAIGGFTGSDPAPTLAQFEKLVSAHEIHYFVTSGSGGSGGPGGGGSGFGAQITAWVKAHFTGKTVGGMTVYDLTTPAARS